MPCIDDVGGLTQTARRLLTDLDEPRTVAELAENLSAPVFRVRLQLREATQAGLVAEDDGRYSRTADGNSLLDFDDNETSATAPRAGQGRTR